MPRAVLIPHGVGRYNHVQGGSIYFTPSTWSDVVRGDIPTARASLGWERSRLGYPKSDEYGVANGDRRQDCEHASILWSHVPRQTTVGYF
ncbi:hypothetical protein LO772_12340 [Yinghuangia sp. ASG 101]|uniref:LGFP repeat-containing protein n=1 Tax=Yinghuangia sp. ASG 101 TaxID=2896848 RepID=UPI001E348496|nr:hypothetical protein [Yinghuangia sp. ASG 101]UGQ14304.1 hypothetical protein LO772_12340 [Yinghuangia sp. ASG 101]